MKGQIVFITGPARGIGAAVARVHRLKGTQGQGNGHRNAAHHDRVIQG